MRWFLWCLSCRQKLREHSIKRAGNLEKVGNRVVAIASVNTCKHQLENFKQMLYIFLGGKFIPQISYSVHFLLIATANGGSITLAMACCNCYGS